MLRHQKYHVNAAVLHETKCFRGSVNTDASDFLPQRQGGGCTHSPSNLRRGHTLLHVPGSNFSATSAAEPSLSFSNLVDEILGTHDPRMSNAGTLMLPLNAAIDIKLSRGKFGR
jgi:hypothetical protein